MNSSNVSSNNNNMDTGLRPHAPLLLPLLPASPSPVSVQTAPASDSPRTLALTGQYANLRNYSRRPRVVGRWRGAAAGFTNWRCTCIKTKHGPCTKRPCSWRDTGTETAGRDLPSTCSLRWQRGSWRGNDCNRFGSKWSREKRRWKSSWQL
jgi:hypothetical protein